MPESILEHMRGFINRRLLIWISVCMAPLYMQGQNQLQPTIQGVVSIDTTLWRSVIYLSDIRTFNNFNTMSNDMIIDQAQINPDGSFVFNTEYLPAEDRVYRLHIAKKDAPPASLIIGGKDENHLFFIANNNTQIRIIAKDITKSFSKSYISGYRPNLQWQTINDIIKTKDSMLADQSMIKKELIENANTEKLLTIADSASHPLVSLYAVKQSGFSDQPEAYESFYSNYLKKWKNDQSSYFKDFRSQLPKSKFPTLWVVIALSCFLLGFIANYFIRNSRSRLKKQLGTLSIQERKILKCIQEGKSNKEISREFNIGVSTVKSHVSNIYAKLNIKSRKETMNIDL